ncbi:MAG: hypothetical protein AAF687_10645 [Pseudomonadota bacterium]
MTDFISNTKAVAVGVAAISALSLHQETHAETQGANPQPSVSVFSSSNQGAAIVTKKVYDNGTGNCEAVIVGSKSKTRPSSLDRIIYIRYTKAGRIFLGMGFRNKGGDAYWRIDRSDLRTSWNNWRLDLTGQPSSSTAQRWQRVPHQNISYKTRYHGDYRNIPVFEISRRYFKAFSSQREIMELRVSGEGSYLRKNQNGNWARTKSAPRTMTMIWNDMRRLRSTAGQLASCQRTL